MKERPIRDIDNEGRKKKVREGGLMKEMKEGKVNEGRQTPSGDWQDR